MNARILTILLCVICSGCGLSERQEALRQAIESNMSEEWKKEFCNSFASGGYRQPYELGRNNLSFFLITHNRPISNEYEYLEYFSDLEGYEKQKHLNEYLKTNHALIPFSEISEVRYIRQNNIQEIGEFTVDSKLYKARFLFIANPNENYRVTRLVIAKNNSSDVNEGYLVFDLAPLTH